MAIGGGIVVVAALAWHFRWGIGLRAVQIVDPVVRRWAAGEVRRLSDGAYQLTASPIRVDVGARRITVDTIMVRTDSAANRARSTPLPALTLRFHHCGIDGVDLDRLAAGEGFAARRAGCDTVAVIAEVPRGIERDTTGSFLSLREDLELSRRVPAIQVDSVVFPALSVALGIEGATGRRTAVAFDRLAVTIDSVDYRRNKPLAERRTLFSRNVRVGLDAFSGSREAADRLDIAAIRADLAAGTFLMDGFAWAPVPGALADSLGLQELQIDSLRLTGVDWRAFLTQGDAIVRTLVLRGARLTVTPTTATPDSATAATAPLVPWALEQTLRAIARGVRLDTLDARDLRVTQTVQGAEAITTVDTLGLAELRFGFDSTTWSGATPVGPLRIRAAGVQRSREDLRATLAMFALDLGAGTVRAHAIRYGPTGSDADFIRRRRWRTDRIAVAADSIAVSGLDAAAWIRRVAYRAARVEAAGVHLDVLSDKRMPSRNTRVTRRAPQEWLRTSGLDLHVDTAVVRGRVTYRERAARSPRTGTLRFEGLTATLVNAGTDRSRMAGPPTIRMRATARLMGVAPLEVSVTVPPFAEQFDMSWSGRVGTMPMAAMNELVTGISDLRFNGGTLDQLTFRAETRGGVARGRVQPRWRELSVELPGIARTGILQGLRRAIAKFAANQFVVRRDNYVGMKDHDGVPVDGDIVHRWTSRETLIQHLWNALRDALLVTIRQ